jgi:hypothetical protein
MNRIKSPKRLNLRRETLLSLTQLPHVVGGSILVPTKPQASCFIMCQLTDGCLPTQTCPADTFGC